MPEKPVITNPKPLNLYGDFPYKIIPFPIDWLLQYTSLSSVHPSPDLSNPESTPPDSLELWT